MSKNRRENIPGKDPPGNRESLFANGYSLGKMNDEVAEAIFDKEELMKKVLSFTLAALMSFSLAGCGSQQTDDVKPASTASASEPATAMKVAMVTDYGDITDQSFNQITYETAKSWSEKNGVEFTYKKPATNADQDREASMEQAIEEGYNVLILPGFAFAKAVVDVAPTYPDVHFVVLDVSQYDLDQASGTSDWHADNVYSAIYKEELAGYMAGVAAVKLGYKKLGYLGGMAVPSVVRYGYGFAQGADAAAEELGLSDVSVKYVYGGAFAGNPDVTARMDTWLADGVECVFVAGGSIYTSYGEAAKSAGFGKLIGVDVDQKASADADYGDGFTVTSAMKGLAPTVNLLLDAIKDGKWSDFGGQIQELGIVSADDPSLNYVQLPETTSWNETFTQEDYKALVGNLADGSIKVDNDISKEPKDWTFKAISLTDEGSMG